MISSETKILLKRSGEPGRVPSLADLKLGELGVNYYDGKLFFRQENDVVGARIIEPGQGDVIGKTIFVTVNGNDNNSGLNEKDAKRTIKAAAAVAEAVAAQHGAAAAVGAGAELVAVGSQGSWTALEDEYAAAAAATLPQAA